MALTKATLIDLNSNELVLDLDADTSITADTDDTIHFKIAGSDEITMTATAIAPSTSDGQALGTSSLMFSDLFVASGSVINFNNGDVTLTHSSNLLTLDGGALDLDGEALVLDADGDTKLVESSDDVIHLQFAGSTSTPTEFGAGYMNLKNQGTRSYIRFYCESSNAHYTELRAAAHSDYSGNVQVTLPVTAGTLATLTGTETFTNKTLTTPVIAEIDSGSTITLDATTDIVLDADGGDIFFKDGGTTIATFTNSSSDFIIESAVSDNDIIFKVNDGGSSTEVARFDGDVSSFKMASGKKIMLGAAEETISGDGTDITFEVGSSGDINIPANIGLTFGDDGEKIEGDGTDLTISGNNINLTATADVVIPNNVGIQFGGASEKIEGDGTDLTISANNLTIDAAADISLDAAGNDFKFLSGGTEILNITNSSSDVVIKPIVDAKDIIFQQRDGTEVARIEDNGTFNVVTDKLAINGTAVTSTAAELNKLDGAGTIKQAGKETIWVPAVAMYPSDTGGCADIAGTELASDINRPFLKVLAFDKDSDEAAQFSIAFPKSWDEGTITFAPYFTANTTNTGDVKFMLKGRAFSDNDALNQDFGTAQGTAKSHSGTAYDLNIGAESSAITIAGSPAAEDQVFFQIFRDVSADSMTADALLTGIKIFFTTDAANDA